MRTLPVLAVAAMLFLPLASAGPVPTISISIDNDPYVVNATNASQFVTVTGQVLVNKSALLTATVTLSAAVDTGWDVSVSPTSMTFTSTQPQAFSCTVVVPAGTPGGNDSALTVTGIVVSGVLRATDTATAEIRVVGTLPGGTNQTGNNTNGNKPPDDGNQTVPIVISRVEGAPGFLGYSYEQWGLIGAGAVAVIVAGGFLNRARRKRKAALQAERPGQK